MSSAWTLLIVAGLLEVVWAVGLKYTHGFTRPLPSAITLTAMVLSIVLLGRALRSIPVGTGYAVWTAITQSHITNSSVLLIVLAVLILLVGLVSEQISSLRVEGRQ